MDVAVRKSNGDFLCLIFSDFFDHSFCNQLYKFFINHGFHLFPVLVECSSLKELHLTPLHI